MLKKMYLKYLDLNKDKQMTDEVDKMESAATGILKSSNAFAQAMQGYQDSCNSYWNSLTPEEQLMAFCAIVEKLAKGEIDEGRSYRGILYDTFGWGPEAYASAQCAGFLDLHNSIYSFNDLKYVFKNTLKELEIEVDPAKLADALAKHFY